MNPGKKLTRGVRNKTHFRSFRSRKFPRHFLMPKFEKYNFRRVLIYIKINFYSQAFRKKVMIHKDF